MKAILVVAKRPEAGQTKTRLTPPLTPEQAAQLYEAFLQDTLDLTRQLASRQDVRLVIAYLPEDASDYFHRLAPEFDLLPQRGLELGERLDNALTYYLNNGFQQAIIMDSDSPTLPGEYLVQASMALETADTVIGPCDDGGYYLIGLNRPAPRLLREVRMSTSTVLHDTLALAAEEKMTVAQLPAWYDVDTLAELGRLRHDLKSLPPHCAPHTRAALLEMTPLQIREWSLPLSEI